MCTQGRARCRYAIADLWTTKLIKLLVILYDQLTNRASCYCRICTSTSTFTINFNKDDSALELGYKANECTYFCSRSATWEQSKLLQARTSLLYYYLFFRPWHKQTDTTFPSSSSDFFVDDKINLVL